MKQVRLPGTSSQTVDEHAAGTSRICGRTGLPQCHHQDADPDSEPSLALIKAPQRNLDPIRVLRLLCRKVYGLTRRILHQKSWEAKPSCSRQTSLLTGTCLLDDPRMVGIGS